MTILVTGSAGHLGEALVRILRTGRRAARGLDIKPSPFTDVVASIVDRQAVEEAMEGVEAVINTATLHKPHVVTHPRQQFVDTNVTGTLNLLDAAVRNGVRAFIQTSTTSTFGEALTPGAREPAAWITEDVMPIPKNIYGATKLAAEHLCQITARSNRLAVVVLRSARFFPEEDDNALLRKTYSVENMQAMELLYRRADLEDVASAHLAALERAPDLGFGQYIISATTPFERGDLEDLGMNAAAVIAARFPESEVLFREVGWRCFPTIDRVYDNRRARQMLGWTPRIDFAHVLECLGQGKEFRSPLALEVGVKGYHDEVFENGPYPV